MIGERQAAAVIVRVGRRAQTVRDHSQQQWRNGRLTGKEAEEALDLAGITVNKNSIPFDQRPPTITSGIRLGSPALTTRGMKESEMAIIADFMHQALTAHRDQARLSRLEAQVRDFCHHFPLFAEEWLLENPAPRAARL